jgi:hypothetical protein
LKRRIQLFDFVEKVETLPIQPTNYKQKHVEQLYKEYF